jgi:flagellar FliJ protein
MAKFIFSMQNILQIKEKLEEQAKAEYSVQMGILRQEEEKLAQLKRRKDSMQQQLKAQISAVLDLMQIRRLEDGVENLKYNMNVQKTVIAGQQQKVAKAREKLDHAMIERKTYEKLKENAFEEFKKEVNAEEQKEINELVSFRFGNSREREG